MPRWPPTPGRHKAEGDRKLAKLYLSKMQFAYGPDEASWGSGHCRGRRQGASVNLYAEHLRGTEARCCRAPNLYGMLTTDDPFQYLGGIGLAVRHLDGKAPELYISNLRGSRRRPRGRLRPRSSWPRSWPRATSTPATSRA
jgi:cobaltochelatase CobN